MRKYFFRSASDSWVLAMVNGSYTNDSMYMIITITRLQMAFLSSCWKCLLKRFIHLFFSFSLFFLLKWNLRVVLLWERQLWLHNHLFRLEEEHIHSMIGSFTAEIIYSVQEEFLQNSEGFASEFKKMLKNVYCNIYCSIKYSILYYVYHPKEADF